MEESQHSRLLMVFQRFGRMRPFFPRTTELPQGEFFLLHSIGCCQRKAGGGVRISVISNVTHMSMPAVSQMLNSLENKGMIRRSMDKGDRRAVFVSVTEKGEALMCDAMEKVNRMMNAVEQRLGEEDTSRFIEISARLFQILEDYRDGLEKK